MKSSLGIEYTTLDGKVVTKSIDVPDIDLTKDFKVILPRLSTPHEDAADDRVEAKPL